MDVDEITCLLDELPYDQLTDGERGYIDYIDNLIEDGYRLKKIHVDKLMAMREKYDPQQE